ncbi:unnamed protein product, partial [Gongylonema pulchrum]|uniref:Photolyase/cryptochrome alpha/beta domain-containing protein n=1 Tax=Gongylonema pulchrum TaxID=637853 RepID=A0A183DKR1_9BILA
MIRVLESSGFRILFADPCNFPWLHGKLERYSSVRRLLIRAGIEDDCYPITLASKIQDIPTEHLYLPEKTGEGLFDKPLCISMERRRAAQCEKHIRR